MVVAGDGHRRPRPGCAGLPVRRLDGRQFHAPAAVQRVGDSGGHDLGLDGRLRRHPRAGQHVPARLGDFQASTEYVGQDRGHRVDAATVQDDVGQPVVGAGRELDRLRMRPDRGIGRVEFADRRLLLLEQPGVLQRDRGVGGK